MVGRLWVSNPGDGSMFIQSYGTNNNLSKNDLGGGFKYFLVLPYLEKISNLTNIFQMGWFNHQLDD